MSLEWTEEEEARFLAKVDKTETCWNWTGFINKLGYGGAYLRRRRFPAHRLSHEFFIGPIPEGLDVDHMCHNRGCVNPAHLRAVTRKQNMENLGPVARSSSGIRGVVWQSGKWKVQVRHNDDLYYGGRFSDLAEAEAAAIALRNRLYTHNDLDRRAA